jgi:hypothetical protein
MSYMDKLSKKKEYGSYLSGQFTCRADSTPDALQKIKVSCSFMIQLSSTTFLHSVSLASFSYSALKTKSSTYLSVGTYVINLIYSPNVNQVLSIYCAILQFQKLWKDFDFWWGLLRHWVSIMFCCVISLSADPIYYWCWENFNHQVCYIMSISSTTWR